VRRSRDRGRPVEAINTFDGRDLRVPQSS
jgi:hypothetical protein